MLLDFRLKLNKLNEYAKIKVIGNIETCYILGYKLKNNIHFVNDLFCELIGVTKTGTILTNEICGK